VPSTWADHVHTWLQVIREPSHGRPRPSAGPPAAMRTRVRPPILASVAASAIPTERVQLRPSVGVIALDGSVRVQFRQMRAGMHAMRPTGGFPAAFPGR
jgi:hypothetical protein